MSNDTVLAIKAAITSGLALLTALWGWFGWEVLIWVFLMLADLCVGSALAGKDGRWCSAKLREGLWHKGGMILIVGISLITDLLIGSVIENIPNVTLPFDYSVLLGPLVILWYIMGELGSLAEHAVDTGAPVPGWLLHILDAGKKAIDSTGDKLVPNDENSDGTAV